MVLSTVVKGNVSHTASAKPVAAEQIQKLGPVMSQVDGAAAGACILSYIRCADLGQENAQSVNTTRNQEETDQKSRSRRTRKRKTQSHAAEVQSNVTAARPPHADMASEVTAKSKRKMQNRQGHKSATDDRQSTESKLQVEPSSDNMTGIGNDKELCEEVIQKLQSTCKSEQHAVMVDVADHMRELALSRHGTWVAQTALDVARGADRDALIAAIRDHVVELYACPYGNHVLSKAIEVLPRHKITFIVSALAGQGVAVAKHRFGCRVVCRLFEHCSEEELRGLFDEFVCEAAALARHQFGNFIIQSLLEHAYPVCGRALLDKLLPHAPQLAQHRFGSLVMQRLLDFSDVEGQKQLISKLMWHPSEGHACTLVEVACTHYGSFVVEQLASMKATSHEVYVLLQTNVLLLLASEHGQRVIEAFKLSIPESA
mmetsp:Transcript_4643/g.8407  ORF Transcript_4643/g.8407 Transcript_4643/m.8407 type:complete len:429 (-) Transcript_4643:391-1677(-)